MLCWFYTVQWKACVETPSWWRTLVGEEDEEDLRASAKGPPMWWWLWWVPPPLHQLMFCWSLPLLLLRASSSLPVDSFRETSEEEFPGMEMERQVAELMGLELLSASERGQSSKKCLRMCPPSDLLLLNPLWDSYGRLLLLLLSCLISEQLLTESTFHDLSQHWWKRPTKPINKKKKKNRAPSKKCEKRFHN